MKKDKIEKWLSQRSNLNVNENEISIFSKMFPSRFIDPQTGSDLLLYEYFCLIDKAFTTPGRNILYTLLRSPLKEKSRIDERRAFINILADNHSLKTGLKKLFFKSRSSESDSLNPVLFEDNRGLFTREKLAFSLIIFVLTVITIPLLFPKVAGFSILVFLIFSFLIFAANQSLYNIYIPGMIELYSHICTAQKILKLLEKHEAAGEHLNNLSESLIKINKIIPALRILSTGTMNSSDIFQITLFWLKNIFCIDLIVYNKAVEILNSDKSSFIEFYCRYGLIDALQSIARIVEIDTDSLCTPEIHEESTIQASDIFHPLLEQPVSNSITVKKGLILTGSNMSGKSTFLRTIGVNVVLAQSLTYCYAGKMVMPVINVLSVINKHDDLGKGESFYMYEANRINEMIMMSNKEQYLFLIDELLSGTNSLERVSASIAIIRFLNKQDSIISMVATHDVSIAENLENECDCCFFSDDVKNGGMYFDYKLRRGIIRSTNAIRMLKEIGLPEEIIDTAKDRITLVKP